MQQGNRFDQPKAINGLFYVAYIFEGNLDGIR